jgi:hypothetical protein
MHANPEPHFVRPGYVMATIAGYQVHSTIGPRPSVMPAFGD